MGSGASPPSTASSSSAPVVGSFRPGAGTSTPRTARPKRERGVSVALDKYAIIEDVLSNSVYTPQAGMIVQLRKTLGKMSRSDLSNLQVIIAIKTADARDDGQKIARMLDKNDVDQPNKGD